MFVDRFSSFHLFVLCFWFVCLCSVSCAECCIDRCLSFCTFLVIVLSVLLRFTYFDYSFDIFKLFLTPFIHYIYRYNSIIVTVDSDKYRISFSVMKEKSKRN